MFCKWCGADLPISATQCRRCGKDVPALSDCGGFYDLIPNAKRSLAEPPIVQQSSKNEPAQQEPMRQEPVKRGGAGKGKGNSGRKALGLLTFIVCFCFALVFLFLSILHYEVGRYTDGIDQLRYDLSAMSASIGSSIGLIQDSLATEEETEPSVPTDPDVPTAPILEDQDSEISLQILNSEDGVQVITNADFGNYYDAVSTVVDFDKLSNSLIGARFELSESKGYIEATIEQRTETGYTSRAGNILVTVDVDETAFGVQYGEATYRWQYRFVGDTNWDDLDGLFIQNETGSELHYSISDFEALPDKNERDVELRLVVRRENTREGTLTLEISGIIISQNTFEIKTKYD